MNPSPTPHTRDRAARRAARVLFLAVPFTCALASSCAKAPPEPESRATSAAEQLAPRLAAEPTSAIEARLYPPDLIMSHQGRLNLTEAQRQAILAEVQTSQTELLKIDADLRREKELLAAAVDPLPVDETEAMTVARRVMELENQTKSAHLALLIRIKNQLSKEQKAQLDALR